MGGARRLWGGGVRGGGEENEEQGAHGESYLGITRGGGKLGDGGG